MQTQATAHSVEALCCEAMNYRPPMDQITKLWGMDGKYDERRNAHPLQRVQQLLRNGRPDSGAKQWASISPQDLAPASIPSMMHAEARKRLRSACRDRRDTSVRSSFSLTVRDRRSSRSLTYRYQRTFPVTIPPPTAQQEEIDAWKASDARSPPTAAKMVDGRTLPRMRVRRYR